MKRIIISQRRDSVPGRDEIRDGLDERFGTLLWEMGFVPMPVCNATQDPISYVAALKADGVLLTGGNDIGQALGRDVTESALLESAARHRLPVLGICRGMQVINYYQGGTTYRCQGHVATRHWLQGNLFGMPIEVNSYHNNGMNQAGLGRDLNAIMWDETGSIEAFRHHSLPWLGIMWHPEREPEPVQRDLNLIRDHFNIST